MLSHQNLQKLLPQWIVSAQLQQKRHYICMIRYFETESLCYTAEINTTLQISNAVLCSPQLLSCVQLFATLWTEACQAPLSMGILQARILEWVAMSASRGSSQPRDRTRSPTLQVDSLPSELPGRPKSTGMGSLSLLQGIFPIQQSSQGLLHYRRILYQLSYQEFTKPS